MSVDRVQDRICLPYQYFKSTIYEKRIEMFESALLTEEIIGLERDNNSGKVDHSPSGINSKDSCDAVCGALWNASSHGEEFAFNFGETLEATTDVNIASVEEQNKQQIMLDFENMLKEATLFHPTTTLSPTVPIDNLIDNTITYIDDNMLIW